MVVKLIDATPKNETDPPPRYAEKSVGEIENVCAAPPMSDWLPLTVKLCEPSALIANVVGCLAVGVVFKFRGVPS
jgi:hypothetical protein